jgi:hypothetical protein
VAIFDSALEFDYADDGPDKKLQGDERTPVRFGDFMDITDVAMIQGRCFGTMS